MDSSVLGKKIKEARLAKKMTQAEVVGDFITRNMLSQIESGTATPSVKTLEYLCRVLEVPVTTIMPSEAQDFVDYSSSLTQLKDLYLSGKYEKVINFSDSSSVIKDEINAIKAKANLALAQKLSASDSAVELQKAIECAKNAVVLSQIGIYENETVKNVATKVVSQLAHKLSEYYKSLII